jgi:tetratricopeptide (TPR) repeat protein
MDAVTYPNPDVIEFVHHYVVPVVLPFDAKPEADRFNVKWTPTLIVLDSDGGEHHRSTGFLSPEELLPMILLGIGKAHFEREEFAEAIATFDRVLEDYPGSDSAPEAIYYRAVGRFKATHDAQTLKEGYERLHAEYPSSQWTKRSAPYRLL